MSTTLENAIRTRQHDIRIIAEQLHEWHCHNDHEQDCTFHAETWEPWDSSSPKFVRNAYYDKAERFYNLCMADPNAVFQTLRLVQAVSPAALLKMIEAL